MQPPNAIGRKYDPSISRGSLICLASLIVLIAGSFLKADDLTDLMAKAQKGDAESQYQIGQRYAEGKGVDKDDAQALAWFKKAGEQDLGRAEVSLGSIYAHGFGVKPDWAESIRWYRKAALQGDPVALHNLGLDYNYGHGVEQDYAQAANYYRLGADQGQPRCQYNLGLLYEEGHGFGQSDVEASLFYTLASAHENQIHIFGEAKAKELIERRDRLSKKLTPTQLEELQQRVKTFQARVLVHPRRFGTSNTGATRGWYIWHSFNPDTWEAEIGKDPPGETWKVRVLPWCSTYRYLNYGVRPDEILPGERVNVFLDPDEKDRRGYIDHFQDEICQMKGHGHYWHVTKADNAANRFTANVMAGDKLLDPVERDFVLDPSCAKWNNGKRVERVTLSENDHVYLTWCLRGDKHVVMLISDAASLDAIKQNETDRMAKETAVNGVAGQVQTIDGDSVHFMIFSTHWLQASHLKVGQTVKLSATGKGFLPQGPTVEGTITFRKNRGTYGSGVTDILLKVSKPDEVKQIGQWMDGKIVRLVERGQ